MLQGGGQEKTMNARHFMQKESFGVLFFGGLLGAGAVLLATPLSGRETRKRIEDFAKDMKCRAECYGSLVKTKTSSAIEKGEHFLNERKSVLRAAIHAGVEAYRKEGERLARKHLCATNTLSGGA